MSRVRLALVTVTAATAALALAGPVQAASCTAQFVVPAARGAHPLGQNVVLVELRTLSLGGANLGDEVSNLFARADPANCPVTF